MASADGAGKKKGKHGRQNSIHRRRGLELSNPEMFTDGFEVDIVNSAQKSSDVYANGPYETTNGFVIHSGTMVEIKNYEGVGWVHCALPSGVIGVELEGPLGTGDGVYDDKRYFTCPPNCGVFVNQEDINRILPLTQAPRFDCRQHDIYPGDVVMVNRDVGVGIARYVSAHLIGVELNAPAGDSDGSFGGQRYFQVQQDHALFVAPNTLKKIHPEDLLNKLNSTVERLNEIEEGLRFTTDNYCNRR